MIPSIALTEPFGLYGRFKDTFPLKSTYCVAICPFSSSFLTNSSEATNLPSP